jgi:hypothetical protein
VTQPDASTAVESDAQADCQLILAKPPAGSGPGGRMTIEERREFARLIAGRMIEVFGEDVRTER